MSFWGTLIRELREESGTSIEALADKAGIHRHTLKRIEVGTSAGNIAAIERLLHVYGYELEAILIDDSEPDDPLPLD